MKLCCTKKAMALGQALKHFAWVMLLLVLSVPALVAQSTVSGTLTDSKTSETLPGVSISVKGTTKGTITDIDGKYQINLDKGENVLVFSFVGYNPQEIQVNGQTTIDVALAGDAVLLTEFTTTALNISKEKARITNSVQSVEGAALIKAREPNNVAGLTGKIAGLTIGASPELLRRPNVVLRGSSDLLYVVDGVPINSDTWNINSDDIETFTVLKGATSAALYGFRGRNGAIVITTKKGSKDKRGFQVDFNSSFMVEAGFNAIPKVQDEYGPGDHGRYAFVDGKGGGTNDNDYDVWGPALNGQLIPQYDSPIDPATGKRIPTPFIPRGKDNLTRFLREGLLSTNSLAVSTSGSNYDLRFSLGHNYQLGIVPNTNLNITNFNTTMGFDFTDRLRFETNINYNRQYTDNFPDANYGPNSIIYNIVTWAGADWDIDDMRQVWQEGKEGVQQIYAEYQRYNNPWLMSNYWLRGHLKNDIYGYASLSYELAKDVKVMGRTNVTTYDLFRNEKFPYSAGSYGRDERKGDYREDKRSLFENNTDLILTVGNKKISNLISASGLAGATARTFRYDGLYASTDYLITPGVYALSNSLNPVRANTFSSKMQILSAYYSADVSVGYYLTLSHTGRVDKISTLPQGNQTFYYPSVGASTLVTEYVKLGPISNLKLRGAYANVKDGLTSSSIGPLGFGGNPLGYGDTYFSSYDGPTFANAEVYSTPSSYNNSRAAYYTNTLGNPELQRNSRSEIEFGFDMGLFRNKLNVEFTYFNIKEGPRIFSREISEATGYTAQLANGIFTRRKGVEIHLLADPFKTSAGAFKWQPEINFSTLRETYEEFFTNPDGTQVTQLGNIFTQLGDRVDEFMGGAYFKTQDGQFINDASGRPIRNPVAQFLGNLDPDFVWSFINRFTYKNLSLSIQFDGRQGGVISNYIQRQTFRGGRHIETVQGAMGIARLEDTKGNKAWLGEGVQIANGAAIKIDDFGNITNYGELTFKPNETKTFLQDWISRYYQDNENNLMDRSFAKLREVVLSYNVPMKSNSFFKQMSISLVGRNLLYFAEKKDVDLDQYVNRQRETSFETPTTKRFGVNLNVIF